MVKTMQEPTAPLTTKKPPVGRRAFLATAATVAVVGAGAIAAPQVIPAVESKMQDMGRAAVLNEIGSLEGVSLDAAIRAAEITRAAVKILVAPLARFVAAVGGGALGCCSARWISRAGRCRCCAWIRRCSTHSVRWWCAGRAASHRCRSRSTPTRPPISMARKSISARSSNWRSIHMSPELPDVA